MQAPLRASHIKPIAWLLDLIDGSKCSINQNLIEIPNMDLVSPKLQYAK
jgi:hypothetical protein